MPCDDESDAIEICLLPGNSLSAYCSGNQRRQCRRSLRGKGLRTGTHLSVLSLLRLRRRFLPFTKPRAATPSEGPCPHSPCPDEGGNPQRLDRKPGFSIQSGQNFGQLDRKTPNPIQLQDYIFSATQIQGFAPMPS